MKNINFHDLLVGLITILMIGIGRVNATCQETFDNDRYCISLYGGYYNEHDTPLLIEPSFTWFFTKHIGIGCGMEFTTTSNFVINALAHEQNLAYDRNISWFLIKPSVIFRSPYLLRSDIDGFYRLWVQAETGISMGWDSSKLYYEIYNSIVDPYDRPGYTEVNPKKGKTDWLFWNARASVNFAIQQVVIGAGYGVSTLDYYAGHRNISLPNGSKFPVPAKKGWTQTVFLSLGYCF